VTGEPRALAVEPLTREAFAPYGDVVDTAGVEPQLLNQGTARKYAALATVAIADGDASISLFHAAPRALPLALRMIERHPLGSQAFVPMRPTRFLVVVAGSADAPRPADLRAFLVSGQQGINFRAGVWHHPLTALEESDFLVIDRRDGQGNLDELDISTWGVGLGPLAGA
jgi:ureidoglycolate lyase